VAGTFAELIAASDRRLVVLAELNPHERLIGWTKTGGRTHVYQVSAAPVFQESVVTGGVYRKLDHVRENRSTFYTVAASVAACDAAAGSYYWDTTAGVLYVHTSGGGSPATYTAVFACWRLFCASTGLVLDLTPGDSATGVYFHPWLEGSIPRLSSVRPDLRFGATLTPTGDVSLTNGHGFFNTLLSGSRWTWRNKTVRFKLGGSYNGQTLDYDEYEDLAAMLIESVSADEVSCVFKLKPLPRLFDQSLPVTPYFEGSYPNLGEGVRGTKKWIGYGRATIAPDLTDTTAGAGGEYTIADADFQTLFAVHGVWAVSKTTGESTALSLGSQYSVDLTACTVTVLDGAYAPADYTLRVDVTGKPDGAGSYLMRFDQIVQDMLTTFLGVDASTGLDTDSFTTAAAEAPQELSVWLKNTRTIASVISTAEPGFPSLGRSVLGSVVPTKGGLWRVFIWTPSVDPSTAVSLRKEDFAAFNPRPRIDAVVASTTVFYGQNHATGEWQGETDEDPVTAYAAETDDFLEEYTYLASGSDALVLAQRLQLLSSRISTYVSFKERGSLLAGQIAGGRVLVTYSPAPNADGAYADAVFDIVQLDMTLSGTLEVSGIIGDLEGLGATVGRWTDTGAPAWASATDAEKSVSGFWSDADGLIDPGDPTTAGLSVWW
jgi:hypothetical protein